MLRPCTELEYREYADFVYALALDPARSGYPSYSDGIKTKEMFLESAAQALARENEGLLLFEFGGVAEGWVQYEAMPEDRCLQTLGFHIAAHTEAALAEFLVFAGARFPGYTLDLGFPAENERALGWLTARGIPLLEESRNCTAFPDRLEPVPPEGDVRRITRENFALFRTLHEPAEAGMYWTSDRILRALDRWTVLVLLEDGAPVGAVYFTALSEDWFEIFGADLRGGFDAGHLRALLAAALCDAKNRGGRFMTFFCAPEEEAAARDLGFRSVGGYCCFETRLDG